MVAAAQTAPTEDRLAAWRHALDELKMLPDQEADAADARAGGLYSAFKPWDDWECWLLERVAVEMTRVERLSLEIRGLRDLAARRAERCWDDERRLEAEVLGRSLGRRPAETRLRLERTPQGCDWLVARWDALLRAFEARGEWDEAQRSKALDLQGVAPDERVGRPPEADPAGLARAEVERLRHRRDRVLADLDAEERAMAACGLGPEIERQVKAARNEERACLRRIEWAWAQIKACRFGSRRGAPGMVEPVPTVPPSTPLDVPIGEGSPFPLPPRDRSESARDWSDPPRFGLPEWSQTPRRDAWSIDGRRPDPRSA